MFEKIYNSILDLMRIAPELPPSRWQSIDISDKPFMATRELLNYSLEYPLPRTVQELADDVKPNLPWADVHFETERVSGEPINPGESWKMWPGATSAGTMIREQGQYDHSYAERYWPKHAGVTVGGKLYPDIGDNYQPNQGIRFAYGDLNDLVYLLISDPTTRQAHLPVWFPEDLTAANQNKRVPCTLGYHFIMRDGKLHIVYYMRSCDLIKHFRDDVYLTGRLLLWVLNQLQELDPKWECVTPGTLTMHITSLHMFQADYKRIFREKIYQETVG